MTILRCDRCRREGNGQNWTQALLRPLHNVAVTEREVDLCQQCARDLKQWLEEPPPRAA